MNCKNAVALISLTVLTAPFASAADIACEGCSSSAMQTAAREAGVGNHRVYSVSTAVIDGFNVSCANGEFENRPPPQRDGKSSKAGYGQPIFPACKKPLTVHSLVLNPETYDAIVAVHEYYLETGKSDAKLPKP